MDEKNQVANNEVKETPQVDATQPETTGQVSAEQTAAKETESVDRFDKHPRFQELNKKAKEAEEFKQKYYELLEQQRVGETKPPDPNSTDPYTGLDDVTAKQTREFIEKFVKPEIRKEYDPFIQQFQTEQLNKQIGLAKTEAAKYNIDFDEKLPEVVDYLSRPENRGRLTATEAFRNLYFEEMTNAALNKGKELTQAEQKELMEKKRQANLQSTTVTPKSVIQTDDLARARMNESEKLAADIRYGIEKAKAGERHPAVKVD